jgi:hypothetical protein
MFKNYANAETPTTSDKWRNLNEESRIKSVMSILQESSFFKDFQVIKADPNGQVVINLDKNIPSDKRGLLLLDLEFFLKKKIDKGLTIWCEAFEDKSKLRKLRGINIKTNL